LNFIFRKMEKKDLPAVKTLDKLAFLNPWPENAFNYEIEKNENARLWVAEIEHEKSREIVAITVVWIILDEAHIGTFAVHPDWQQKGIGRQFMANICKELYEAQIIKIFLEVRESNTNAINLYRHFGFKVDGERRNYYRDNSETAILMSAMIRDCDDYSDLIKESDFEKYIHRKEIGFE